MTAPPTKDIELMDKILQLVEADDYRNPASYETLNIEIEYYELLIKTIIQFNRNVREIIKIMDEGTTYESIESLPIITDRFIKEGGFANYYQLSKKSVILSQDDIDKTNAILENTIDFEVLCDKYQIGVSGKTNKYALSEAEFLNTQKVQPSFALQYNKSWKTSAKVYLLHKSNEGNYYQMGYIENTEAIPVIDVIQKNQLRLRRELDEERLPFEKPSTQPTIKNVIMSFFTGTYKWIKIIGVILGTIAAALAIIVSIQSIKESFAKHSVPYQEHSSVKK